MSNSKFTPQNRYRLLKILRDRGIPTTRSYPRRYLADLYLREYGPDEEILEARILLENRLLHKSSRLPWERGA
jgi:hypothetical protein